MRNGLGMGCAILLAIPVFIFLGFMGWFYGAQMWHGTVHFLWSQAYWLIPGALCVGFILWSFVTEKFSWGFLGGIFGIVVIVLWSVASYNRALLYLDTVEVLDDVEATEISFRERAPFDVATAMSTRNMGDTTGNATYYMKSIPAAGEHGMYSTSITRREMFSGYERTQYMEVPLYGQAQNDKVQLCDWSDDASLRFGGAVPSNNLVRAIYQKTPGHVSVLQEDSVAVCEGETPVLYAPLSKLSGFPFAISVPAGVAIYNGETGDLTIEENYDGEIPVYPSFIAENQRLSTQAMGGFWDYNFLHRSGWEDTSGDSGDPNGANRAEFNLASEDADTTYKVTPLTRRGDVHNIVAVGTVEANTVQSGELNTYEVQRYKEGEYRQANSSVADTITADILGGYRAQGLTVFEVIPSRDGTWTATVGKSQSINYRAVIDQHGDVTLYDSKGDRVGGGSTSDDGAVTEDEDATENTTDLDLGKSLDDMSPDELREAMDMILDELAERAQQASVEEVPAE